MTVERWLLPLFEQLGYGRLPDAPDGGLPSADGEKLFAVSHAWQAVPVHLTVCNVDLDRRSSTLPGPAPAAPLLITGPDAGGSPEVRVFDAATGTLLASFFAFDPAFLGGVRVGSVDANGHGIPKLQPLGAARRRRRQLLTGDARHEQLPVGFQTNVPLLRRPQHRGSQQLHSDEEHNHDARGPVLVHGNPP